jgi:hypothetical protein
MLVGGCGDTGPRAEAAAAAAGPDSPAKAVPALANPYPFRSAIIVMENSLIDGEQVMYVDDHGRLTATYTTVEMTMFGQTTRMRSVELYRDGWQYAIDLDERTGTKTRRATPMSVSRTPDVAKLTAEMKERYKLRELGTRQFLGRTCEGYEMEAMGMKVATWSWNNIPMYSETDMGGAEPLVLRVTSLETDVAVPAEKFEIPSDIVITEV